MSPLYTFIFLVVFLSIFSPIPLTFSFFHYLFFLFQFPKASCFLLPTFTYGLHPISIITTSSILFPFSPHVIFLLTTMHP